MPDGSSETVILRAPLGNLSSLLKLVPSLIFTSHKRSSRGDDNLKQAEIFLQITEKQLSAIYSASQQANDSFATEIIQLEDDLDHIKPWLNALKKARESRSGLKQTFQRLSSDSVTKDVQIAAYKLSQKAERTSARVAASDPSRANISLQSAPSSEYSVVPSNELTAYTNLSGIGFSFDRKPTADDTKKIEDVIRLVDPDFYSDDDSTAGSVRGLRSRKSDLSSYSYHYWGPDAYNTGESRGPSCGTSSQLSSQSRTSTGMRLGDNTTFHHCNVNVVNMQSYDSSTVSDATSNLGVDATRRGLLGAPPLPSAGHGSPCPSCGASRDTEAIQDNDILLQNAAAENAQSVPEQYIPDPPVNMQPVSQAGLGDTRQASPLSMAGTQNAKSHSLTASGSAMVFSPTMNFKSPGATGATNTYFSTQPAHSSPPQAFAQNRHLEGSELKCMEFTDNSVVYSPTLNDESPDASGAYNQEIPAAGS